MVVFKMMKHKNILTILLLGSMLAGCSNTEPHEENHDQHGEQHSSVGDIREETTSIKELPVFLADKPEDMQTIYQAAAAHKDLLENIPCYCGCGETANHKNNYDCFVFENKEDGEIVWDDHGTKCGVCLEIAAQSVVDYQEGKTVKEIRTKIDNMYKEGYAQPTPTPEI